MHEPYLDHWDACMVLGDAREQAPELWGPLEDVEFRLQWLERTNQNLQARLDYAEATLQRAWEQVRDVG